ncbi:MAG: TPM domain-containing protein [Pedobacter sp.]|nr:MAG: TPM domain-containing protein [Pedobacter sp.]
MKLSLKLLFIPLITLLSFSACAQVKNDKSGKINGIDTNNIKKPIGWINDFEKVFSPTEIKTLDSLVSNFEKETTIEICVLTVDTAMVSYKEFENYILATSNYWGVGKKEKDNGIVIGFSRGHRKIRIANGIGIEKLISDKETNEIIEKYFIPNFKLNKYYEGTFAGTTELMNLLRTKIKK